MASSLLDTRIRFSRMRGTRSMRDAMLMARQTLSLDRGRERGLIEWILGSRARGISRPMEGIARRTRAIISSTTRMSRCLAGAVLQREASTWVDLGEAGREVYPILLVKLYI